jgi:hypothetical protein
MNAYAKLAIGVAAIAVVAVVGFSLLPNGSSSGVGGPAPSSVPSAAPSPTPSPSAVSRVPTEAWPNNTALPKGTLDLSTSGVPFSVDLPSSSWRTDEYDGTFQTGTFPEPGFAWFLFQQPFTVVSTDPCAGTTQQIGRSIAEQAEAATTIAGTDAVGPTDVTVGGRPAKLVELTLHDDIACDPSEFWLYGDGSMYPNALDSRIRIWFVDVNEVHSTFEFHSDQIGSDATVAGEIQQIVDSIQFE